MGLGGVTFFTNDNEEIFIFPDIPDDIYHLNLRATSRITVDTLRDRNGDGRNGHLQPRF